ncbi:group II decarboxylase [Asimina triloba]
MKNTFDQEIIRIRRGRKPKTIFGKPLIPKFRYALCPYCNEYLVKETPFNGFPNVCKPGCARGMEANFNCKDKYAENGGGIRNRKAEWEERLGQGIKNERTRKGNFFISSSRCGRSRGRKRLRNEGIGSRGLLLVRRNNVHWSTARRHLILLRFWRGRDRGFRNFDGALEEERREFFKRKRERRRDAEGDLGDQTAITDKLWGIDGNAISIKKQDIKIVDFGLTRSPLRYLSPANKDSPDPNTKSCLFYLGVVFALTILARCLSSAAFSKGVDGSTKSNVEDSQVRVIAIIDLINMIVHLFKALVGENEAVVGVGTMGSSEAIMLVELAFKRKWHNKRKAEGKPYDKPNIVTGANVQVCWEKFARYFEVESKEVKPRKGFYVMDPVKAVEMVDENTIHANGTAASPSSSLPLYSLTAIRRRPQCRRNLILPSFYRLLPFAEPSHPRPPSLPPLSSPAAVVALLSAIEAWSSPPSPSADRHPPPLIGLSFTLFHITIAAYPLPPLPPLIFISFTSFRISLSNLSIFVLHLPFHSLSPMIFPASSICRQLHRILSILYLHRSQKQKANRHEMRHRAFKTATMDCSIKEANMRSEAPEKWHTMDPTRNVGLPLMLNIRSSPKVWSKDNISLP